MTLFRQFLRIPRDGWGFICVFCLLGAFFFEADSVMNRQSHDPNIARHHQIPWTLDGMAFMKVAYPQDYAGIQWLNAHARGLPVVAEAYNTVEGYTWASRVTQFTGLPTVINGIHEAEQRYPDELDSSLLCSQTRDPVECSTRFHSRSDDVTTLYDSPQIAAAWRIIHAYNVRFIFVGFLETHCVYDGLIKNICYSHAGIEKFRRMVGQGLRVAFHQPGITIYEVT